MNRPNDQRGPFRGGFPPPPPFRGVGGDVNRGNGGRFGRPPGPFRERSGMMPPHSHPPMQRGPMPGGRGPPRGPHPPGRARMNGGAMVVMPPMRPPVPPPPPRGGGMHGPGNPMPGRARGGHMVRNSSPSPHPGGRGPPIMGGRPIPHSNHPPGLLPPPPPPPPPGRFGRGPAENNFNRPPVPASPPGFRGGGFSGPIVGRTAALAPPRNPVLGPPQRHSGPGGPLMPVPAPPSVSYPAVSPGAQPFTKEQLDAAWTEHTSPKGVKYFHNALSKESTYIRPEALARHQPVVTSNQTVADAKWKEYTDPTTGNVYYSNGITTQWTRPHEMANGNDTEHTEQTTAPKENPKDSSSKKRKHPDIHYESKEAAIAAFKEFLLSKDVSPGLKWSEVVKMLSNQDQWSAVEAHLSTGERKQALAEYQTKRGNELKTLQRQERQRAKETFQRMLTGVLPSVAEFSAWNSTWAGIRGYLSDDSRFQSIEDESTRETLFVDFCEEYRKRDDRRRRAMKREAEENFVALLKEYRNAGRISVTTTWNIFHASLTQAEHADSRLALSEQMDEADQQHLFANYVAEIQRTEEEEKRRSYDERKRIERAQRENYRKMLVRFAEESKLTPSSLWRDSQPLLYQDPSYAPLSDQDPQAPREMFQRFVDDWNSVYLGDRQTLSQLAAYLPKKSAFVNDETTYDEFVRALIDVSSKSNEQNMEIRRIVDERSPISSARLYFDELKNRAKLAATARRGSSRRRDEESSEDEGEIDE